MTLSPRLIPLLATALAGACAHGPPPLRSTVLEIEDSGAGLKAYVRATVAGEKMRMLLDTGAPHSVLPAHVVSARRLKRRTSAADLQIVDANGRLVTLGVAVDVPVRFDGDNGQVALDFLVNPTWVGDEAILAPHELLRRGWAMTIDLEHGALRLDPEAEALRRLGEQGSLREVDFRACREEGLFNNIHRVVTASINGVPAEMLLDTGSTRTVLARNNPALPSMAQIVGRVGSAQGVVSAGQGLLVDAVPVELAGTAFALPVLVLPASQTCWKGALGADLLRHCTMVWGWSSLWIHCRAPAAVADQASAGPR